MSSYECPFCHHWNTFCMGSNPPAFLPNMPCHVCSTKGRQVRVDQKLVKNSDLKPCQCKSCKRISKK